MFRQKFIAFLVILSSFTAKAQLDLEHWFPPVFNTGGAIFSAVVSLSTDKSEPFDVYIYSSNILLDTVTLSKDAPVEYKIKNIDLIYTGVVEDALKPIDKGIHLVGENRFYANLKLAGDNTEIISSKGKTALGKSFLIVNDQVILNGCQECNGVLMDYQASITAFSDNTHVKIKGYSKGLVFADRSSKDELDFVLNKGQSYIVVAYKRDNTKNTIDTSDIWDPNLIGASITSDKLIVVDNGNNLSQDLGSNTTLLRTGSVNIDQNLPINKLGKEYFFVNGMSDGNFKMEKALIVATEDDTQIFFNNDTKPYITLQKGQHFIGPYGAVTFLNGNQPDFTNQDGRTIKTTGMFIRSTKPIYCYQMIGTFYDYQPGPYRPAVDRTSAMLLSFPLDVDYQIHPVEFSQIDQIGIDDFRTSKISIKSEKDAVITVNGVALTGGSDMAGKPGWKYNTVIGSVGNIEIKSDKSLNVDFVGGGMPNRRPLQIGIPIMSGYAASVVSYSNDPFILKKGNCVQEEVLLSLSNVDFEGFQWQLNGVNIPGANSPTYIPLVDGSYTCILSYSGVTFTTEPVQVDDCPYAVSTIDLGSLCPNFTITPKFSAPNENLNFIKLEILTPPNNGTAIIENNLIKVTNNAGFTGSDRLVYKMTAANGFYEVVKASFFVFAGPIGDVKFQISQTSFEDPNYTYDLSSAVNNSNGENFQYFPTQSDAEKNTKEIFTVLAYVTDNPTAVFVKISSANGCTLIKKIILLKNIPEVAEVELPNIFTPNGDGINDVWDYSLLKDFSNLKLAIYDRFGKKVYERLNSSEDYSWDGKSVSHERLPTSTYWVFYSYNAKNSPETISKSIWLVLKNRN